MKILRKLGSFATLSLAASLFGASSGCIFEADTPDKVEVETPDVDVTPAEPDTDINVKVDKD
jgi:hypothetical protein